MPLLKMTERDYELIDEDPREFVNGSIDLCSQQISKTYKTKSA